MEMKLIKLTLCGPSDVAREIKIAQEVVQDWNLNHGEAHGFWVKHQHWSTDSHPEIGDRPQAIINRQMLDGSDIVVAIFWTRFGSPTGVADSGTEEEIRRAMRKGRKVMVYFSNLESVTAPTNPIQAERVEQFRQELRKEGLIGNFSSRDQFRRLFSQNLAQALNSFKLTIQGPLPQHTPAPVAPAPTQSIKGNGNTQVGGNLNVYAKPPVIKPVIERRQDEISAAEAVQVHAWIDELVDGTAGRLRSQAYAMWWKRLKLRFNVVKYEALRSDQMTDVESWYKQQRAIQKSGLKTKAPDQWRQARYTTIKATMRALGLTNETYYTEIATRLRMRKPFSSLTDLTKIDLQRVYELALRDAKR